MSGNTAPIYPAVPNCGVAGALQVDLKTANIAEDGSGTVITLFTAGANGSRIDRIRCKPDGSGNNIATRLKIFLNDGTPQTAGAAHSAQITDYSLPATTGSESAQVNADIDIILNMPIPAGWKIQACVGTTVATGWFLTAFGGDY